MSIGAKLGSLAATIVNGIERRGPGLKAGIAKEVMVAKKTYAKERIIVDAETGEVVQEGSK